VLPGPGEAFDIGAFLAAQGTLYMIADPRNDVSPVAPVFSFIANEIHWTASQLAARMRGERIDPPLLMALDEVTKLCPGLPVPSLVSDSGGRGITMVIACQGLAQIEERWGKPAMRMLLDTSAQAYLSGVQDPDTLEMASRLCDTATYRVRGREGETTDVPAATPGMIRRIPKRRALLLRGDCAPVIAHLPMAWHDWAYRRARLARRLVAQEPALPAVARQPVAAPARSAVWGPAGTEPRWLAPPRDREALSFQAAPVAGDQAEAPAYPWARR
jgi:type IV secretion system protein VirD4